MSTRYALEDLGPSPPQVVHIRDDGQDVIFKIATKDGVLHTIPIPQNVLRDGTQETILQFVVDTINSSAAKH